MGDSMERPITPPAGDPLPRFNPISHEEFKQIKSSARAIAQLYCELHTLANEEEEITIPLHCMIEDLFIVLEKLAFPNLRVLKSFYSQYVQELQENFKHD